MSDVDVQQLEQLRTPCVGADFLTRLYMVPWPPTGDYATDFATWAATRPSRPACAAGLLSRWATEKFLRDQRLQPVPWAAAAFGMTPASLRRVLPTLHTLGLRRNYEVYPGVVDDALADDLPRALPGLRYRTAGDHNAFCDRLHDALDAAGVPVEPWYCATSVEIEEYPKQFARHIDALTLTPLSVKHEMWLNTGKPLQLPPDVCSRLTYYRQPDVLGPWLAGNDPPPAHPAYTPFLAAGEAATHAGAILQLV